MNISPVDATGWDSDLLGEDVILSGRKQFFNPGSSKGCLFDSSQAETVQSMQLRWVAFSRSAHYGSTCLDTIGRMRSMHPAASGNGDPGWVQPQRNVCNLR